VGGETSHSAQKERERRGGESSRKGRQRKKSGTNMLRGREVCSLFRRREGLAESKKGAWRRKDSCNRNMGVENRCMGKKLSQGQDINHPKGRKSRIQNPSERSSFR